MYMYFFLGGGGGKKRQLIFCKKALFFCFLIICLFKNRSNLLFNLSNTFLLRINETIKENGHIVMPQVGMHVRRSLVVFLQVDHCISN